MSYTKGRPLCPEEKNLLVSVNTFAKMDDEAERLNPV